MNDSIKKTFLLSFCAIIIVVYMFVDTDSAVEVKVKDGTALNQSTCTNALNSLKAAKFQQRMLDQQVLLSTAAGRTAEAATVSELKAMVTVLKKLIADPKLSCELYLKEDSI